MASTLITVRKVNHLDEILGHWPRLLHLAQQDHHEHLPETAVLQSYLTCYRDGAVFMARGFTGICGGCGVEELDDHTLILRFIPNDKGTGIARACMESLAEWAKNNQYESIMATSNKLSGSSFRYFEKTLGFRRFSVDFKMNLLK